jgi:F-type H+-transporting ATPase subunit b
MGHTVQALGGILLRSIPTFFLILFLTFYLRRMLFAPIEKVLAERNAATVGARQSAEALLRQAERKTVEYQAAIREARAAIFHEQEQTRRQWLDEQATQVRAAKGASEQLLAEAREQIGQEAADAREHLRRTAASLADQIASTILERSAR